MSATQKQDGRHVEQRTQHGELVARPIAKVVAIAAAEIARPFVVVMERVYADMLSAVIVFLLTSLLQPPTPA